MVKLRPTIEHGAAHLMEFVRLNNEEVQLGAQERRAVIDKVKNNPYFGHPEAVILGMLGMIH